MLTKSSCFDKAIAILARVMRAYISKSRDSLAGPVGANELELSKKVLFAASMELTEQSMKKGDLQGLRPTSQYGVLFTRGRVGPALEALLGCDRLPILMPQSRLAELIMWHSHCEDHRRDPMDTLARSRELAWIVRGSKLAKSVCARCSRCRLRRKTTEKQLMSDIPKHQLIPCPPFTNVSLDFMGPFQVKGLGNQRARIKVYGLVIVCQNTRAVKLLPVPGYDTGSFLVAYRRFTNDFGTRELIVSDRGSQLVKAGKILNVEKQDWMTSTGHVCWILHQNLGLCGSLLRLDANGGTELWKDRWPP